MNRQNQQSREPPALTLKRQRAEAGVEPAATVLKIPQTLSHGRKRNAAEQAGGEMKSSNSPRKQKSTKPTKARRKKKPAFLPVSQVLKENDAKRQRVSDESSSSSDEADEPLPSTSSHEVAQQVPPLVAVPRHMVAPEKRRIVVLDNDETTGSYQLGSLLFSMHTALCHQNPNKRLFIDEYLRQGGARPGLISLMRTLEAMRLSQQIDAVVMFTAASNRSGWVTFLKECIETYTGVRAGTITHLIASEDCQERDLTTGRVVKDLSRLCPDTSASLIVDDKPQYVRNGTCIGVTEYTQHVPIDYLVECMPIPEARKIMARQALQQDALVHRASDKDQRTDRELYRVIEQIQSFYA